LNAFTGNFSSHSLQGNLCCLPHRLYWIIPPVNVNKCFILRLKSNWMYSGRRSSKIVLQCSRDKKTPNYSLMFINWLCSFCLHLNKVCQNGIQIYHWETRKKCKCIVIWRLMNVFESNRFK
jgi:hypothetical protein